MYTTTLSDEENDLNKTLLLMTFSAKIIYSFKTLFEVFIFLNLNLELFKQSHMKR
jgi:hypothetical protein